MIKIIAGIPALLIILVLLWYLVVTVHEVGHLLGGWLAGFRLVSIEIGPARLLRSEQGLRFSWQWARWAPDGTVLMVPTGRHHALPRRWAMMIAGAFGAQLLLLVVAMRVLLDATASLPIRSLAAVITIMTLAIFFFSLRAKKSPLGYSTDGMKLRSLLGGGPEAERLCAILAIIAAFTAGQRPREWDPALLDRAVALEDGSEEDVYANLLYYTHHLDRQQTRLAALYLQRALANAAFCSPGLQSQLFFTAAQHEASFGQNMADAHAWLAQIPDQRLVALEPADRLAGEAGLRLAEGQYEEARRLALEGIAAAERSPFRGLARVQIEQLQAIVRAAGHAAAGGGGYERVDG